LNADKAGVKISERGIENDHLQTNIPNIYAIDVVRMLAQKQKKKVQW
jgi:pyruvate/2-oxoglutarate dehydrogenase complex dihydrolipoamide dehydrogenase (E3) component